MTKKSDDILDIVMIGGSGALLDETDKMGDCEGDRRVEIRYDIQHPCRAYHVLPNGDVDLQNVQEGIVWDVSRAGLGLILNKRFPKPGKSLLVQIENHRGESEFQSVSIINSTPTKNDKARVSSIFGGPLARVFDETTLVPRLDPNSMRFEMGFDETILTTLSNLGTLKMTSLDFVQLCPKCQSIPTVRNGCCRCLSGHVSAARMIHHYACAHVDFEETFEYENQIICRKCRAKKLIVGADFEYLDGPNRCADCHQSNLDLIPVGHCTNCNHRFPMSLAETTEIVGYHVAKLDILALINTA